MLSSPTPAPSDALMIIFLRLLQTVAQLTNALLRSPLIALYSGEILSASEEFAEFLLVLSLIDPEDGHSDDFLSYTFYYILLMGK